MKKYILIIIGTIFLLVMGFIIFSTNANVSDFTEDGPADYAFNFEGGNQNSIMRRNMLIIDSGAVDFKYNNKYIVFSVDTTYSKIPSKVSKSKLIYYLHDVKKDFLYKNIDFNEFRKLIKEKSLEDIDISK